MRRRHVGLLVFGLVAVGWIAWFQQHKGAQTLVLPVVPPVSRSPVAAGTEAAPAPSPLMEGVVTRQHFRRRPAKRKMEIAKATQREGIPPELNPDLGGFAPVERPVRGIFSGADPADPRIYHLQ